MSLKKPIQVPLPFVFHGNKDFDSFFTGPNRQVVESLKALAAGKGDENFVFIHGASGLGKSHLLEGTSKAANDDNHGTFFLPLKESANWTPDLFEGLEDYALVCIDDIDAIAGRAEWEHAFFHFFNRHRQASKRLLLSASLPPQRLGIQLLDLASRLKWGLTLELKGLSDEEKLEALSLKAKGLGIALPAEVGRFLLRRYPRDLPNLWRILESLDYASLSEQRKLTIPFLKQHLGGSPKID